MRIYITDRREKKCAHCNWENTIFYGIGNSACDAIKREKAEGSYNSSYAIGMCGNCLAEFLLNSKYKLVE